MNSLAVLLKQGPEKRLAHSNSQRTQNSQNSRKDSQRTRKSRYSFEVDQDSISSSSIATPHPLAVAYPDPGVHRSGSSRDSVSPTAITSSDSPPVSPTISSLLSRRSSSHNIEWRSHTNRAATEPLVSTEVAPKPRIVLAIDFGTTFTGIAWLQATGEGTETLADVQTFRDWPGEASPKVPSAISYSQPRSNKRHNQWGYDIDDGSKVMQWTKLELEPRATMKELEILLSLAQGLELANIYRAGKGVEVPKHLTRDSWEIVRDYLGKITRTWHQRMRSEGKYTLAKVPLDIVVTHPASWKYGAMNKTYRAVMGALPKGLFPTLRDVHFTSEPESCALWVVQDLIQNDIFNLVEGDCFVLCDAGGGTVDLVSYRVRSIEPLDLELVGGISGNKFGASFIDQAFLDFIEPRLDNNDIVGKDSSSAGHVVVLPTGRVLLKRFQKVKHAFDGSKGGVIQLPRDLVATPEHEEELSSGVLTLTEQDLKGMFEKSVRGTLDLIERQIIQVENIFDGDSPLQVTNIFMSGGFSESAYLLKEVTKFGDARNIDVQRAENCWSSVVKGAVLKGMGMGADPCKKVEACRRHYGFSLSSSYTQHKHSKARSMIDPHHGRRVAVDQLEWVVRKGSVILPDNPIRANLSMTCKYSTLGLEDGAVTRIIFVATELSNPPSRLDELPLATTEIVELDIKSSDIPPSAFETRPTQNGKEVYHSCTVEAEFIISHGVRVNIKCGGKLLRYFETKL